MVERVNGTIKNATVKVITYQNIDEMSPIFIDYPEFLQLQAMVEIPCNEISKKRFVKDIF
jgi:hypothetical protein